MQVTVGIIGGFAVASILLILAAFLFAPNAV